MGLVAVEWDPPISFFVDGERALDSFVFSLSLLSFTLCFCRNAVAFDDVP